MASGNKSGVASHADFNRNSLFNMKGTVALVTGQYRPIFPSYFHRLRNS